MSSVNIGQLFAFPLASYIIVSCVTIIVIFLVLAQNIWKSRIFAKKVLRKF